MPSNANADISNGTCYFGKHNETKGDVLPCGNVAFGNWPCCFAGSSCLGFESANACFDPDTGNTYIAGCTDEAYVDKTCPQKLRFDDQEWVGLAQCGTESDGNWDWGGCEVPAEDSTELVRLPNDNCEAYCSTTLWVGTSDIPTFAIVPTSAGGSITWTSGFNPTSTSRPPGTVATSTSAATQSASQGPSSSTAGLSTGAKAGIGVGAAAGGLLILGMLFFCLRRYRRARQTSREQQQQQQQQSQQVHGHGHLGPTPWSPAPTYLYPHDASVSSAHSPTTVAASPSPGKPPQAQTQQPPYAACWVLGGHGGHGDAFTGFKNELPADEIGRRDDAGPSPPSSPGHGGTGQQQLDGGERKDAARGYGGGGGGGNVSSDGGQGGGQHGQQVDPLGRFWVSPQSTGRSGPQTGYPDGEDTRGRGAFGELQG